MLGCHNRRVLKDVGLLYDKSLSKMDANKGVSGRSHVEKNSCSPEGTLINKKTEVADNGRVDSLESSGVERVGAEASIVGNIANITDQCTPIYEDSTNEFEFPMKQHLDKHDTLEEFSGVDSD